MSDLNTARINYMLVEAQAFTSLRMGLGACVGMLHEPPDDADLQNIKERLASVQILLDSIIGIRESHK